MVVLSCSGLMRGSNVVAVIFEPANTVFDVQYRVERLVCGRSEAISSLNRHFYLIGDVNVSTSGIFNCSVSFRTIIFVNFTHHSPDQPYIIVIVN